MVSDNVIEWLAASPSPFHATALLRERLLEEGYEELSEREVPALKEGHGYFYTRNGSSLIAFYVPERKKAAFRLSMVHLDSPTWKLKPHPVIEREEGTVLDVEPYGGLIDYTWFDRPLTIAGRVMVRDGNAIRSRLLYVDRDLLSIPSLAIHLNRGVNESAHFDRKGETFPLLSLGPVDFEAFLGKELGVKKEDVLSFDLFLASRLKPCKSGLNEEFLLSPRLDDLASAYSSFLSFLAAKKEGEIQVYYAADNEEVGSLTRQGAASTFLQDTLKRIASSLGFDYRSAVASSFALSIDNAHATHPNYAQFADPTSRVILGKGIVIKSAASETYTTNAFSSALLKALAQKEKIPYQEFTNRSDLRGGSTLGNLSTAEVPLLTADIGIPQLAMHSSYELCAVKDIEAMAAFVKAFYSTSFEVKEDGYLFLS